MELNHPGSRDLSKRKSAGRMMASVFRVHKGLLLDFMEKGTTLNAAIYCETLARLRVTSRQRPGLLTTGVLLLHDKVGTALNDVTQHNTCSASSGHFWNINNAA